MRRPAHRPGWLLQARILLTGLLNTAPPQRRSSVTRRLDRTEELVAGNFPQIWCMRPQAVRLSRPRSSESLAAARRRAEGCRPIP